MMKPKIDDIHAE